MAAPIVTMRNHRVDDKEARHEEKVLAVILNRFREARRSRTTGKLTIEIQLMKGGPTNIYTEIGITYKVLEEL